MPPATPCTVLLADDHALVRSVVAGWLRDAGYIVVEAGDGEQAWREIERATPDLVISDLRMPRVGGVELVRRLRAKPGAEDVPVILVSGAMMRHEEAAPGSLFLEKPFATDVLLESVARALDRPAGGAVAVRRGATRRAAGR